MHTGVSVIIAAYHAHETVARAIRSLLDQSWTAWQAIIVSDDGTNYHATLDALRIDDPRVVFTNTGRIGAGAPAARNAGLRIATMPLIAPLDADDRYLPNRLEMLVPLALEYGAAFDNISVVRDEDDTSISTLFSTTGGIGTIEAAKFLKTSIPMFPVIRRELCPTWEDDINFCDDVVFNMQVFDRIERAPLVHMPLYEYRQRAGSITFSADSGNRAERCYCHVLERLKNDGLGIKKPKLRNQFALAIKTKRDINTAYEAAFKAGCCANFQEFLALRI